MNLRASGISLYILFPSLFPYHFSKFIPSQFLSSDIVSWFKLRAKLNVYQEKRKNQTENYLPQWGYHGSP